MPKTDKQQNGSKRKLYAVPTAQRKKDFGIPKLQSLKANGKQAMPLGSNRPQSTQALSTLAAGLSGHEPGPSTVITSMAPVDASLAIRDSSSKAFMRELRKVIEKSDVIIQVLDARDPEGTRSRWVEEEVRKRDSDGKKLLAVVNKIDSDESDLVPRANLEGWLKHLRHSFPCMPFKSSTQSQRQNLSQNLVPLSHTTSKPGEKATYTELPTTSSSLGAPALLHLLKQYALSTPHSSLTVGVVGYPNVGKSSLINSLKRSRACAVAAMPGKTRVTQEVVLDKGVKIIDCPGVVLEDFGREMEGEEGRRKQAEIMLRNCIKAELVEDPISPVEVILLKSDPMLLQRTYNLPPFDGVRDFLIKLALTRGRLGKGGIPDLEGTAVSILRDWNSGKIPYHTTPPQHHASSAPARSTAINNDVGMEDANTEPVGDAKILNTLSQAFTLEGLFDDVGEGGEWQGDEPQPVGDVQEVVQQVEIPASAGEKIEPVPTRATKWPSMGFDSSDESDGDEMDDPTEDIISAVPAPPPISGAFGYPDTIVQPARSAANPSKLFSTDEISLLPSGVLDRQKAKQAAKKARKRKAEQERTEGELMYGFMGMDVDEAQKVEVSDGSGMEEKAMWMNKRSKKEKKKASVRRAKEREMAAREQLERNGTEGMAVDDKRQEELAIKEEMRRKEAEFARFLQDVGADEEL